MADETPPEPALVEIDFSSIRYAVETAIKLKTGLTIRTRREIPAEAVSLAVASYFAERKWRVFARPPRSDRGSGVHATPEEYAARQKALADATREQPPEGDPDAKP